MPPASNDEQFKFLISCIRYSHGGKVDFEKVARECHIVSKGAAAKRYERMMKTHGIAPINTNSPNKNVSSPKSPSQKEDLEPTCKKRKVETFHDEDEDDFEEYYAANVKTESATATLTQPIKTEMGQAKVFQTKMGQDMIFQTKPVKGKASGRRKPAFVYENEPFADPAFDLLPGSDYSRGNFVNAPYTYVHDKPFQLSAVQATILDTKNEESGHDNSIIG